MKLVEILARELSEWEFSEFQLVTQENCGNLWYADSGVYVSESGNTWLSSDGHYGGVLTVADDRKTSIVSREMWEAERLQIGIDAANAGKTTPLAEIKAKYSFNPLTSRDRIRAIDVQLADLTLERAERIAELAAEGFALLPVVDAVDMEDWRNWKAGDLLEVVDRQGEYHSFNVGDVVTMLEHDTNLGRPAPYCKSSDGDYGWVMADKMKFHSRPKPC